MPSNIPVTKHIYQGIDYEIFPDMGKDDTDDSVYIVVIGSFPEGRYFQPITLGRSFADYFTDYLDHICLQCLRSYQRAINKPDDFLPESPDTI